MNAKVFFVHRSKYHRYNHSWIYLVVFTALVHRSKYHRSVSQYHTYRYNHSWIYLVVFIALVILMQLKWLSSSI